MWRDLDQLLLGRFTRYSLYPNFDSPSQAARYDVVGGMKDVASREWANAIQAFRRHNWAMPPGTIAWQPCELPKVDSGLIYVSSGRGDWFCRSGMISPILL